MTRGRKTKQPKVASAKPSEALKRRLAALRSQMRDEQVDALIVTNPLDIRYLTGFVGDDSWALISAKSNAVTVLTDGRFEEQLGRDAPHVKAVIRKKPMVDALAEVLSRRRVERIGFAPEHVTVSLRARLVKQFGAGRLKAIDTKLIRQRAVKSDDEVKAVEQALSIQQRAYEQMLEFVEPGMTEAAVCAYLEYRMRALGADGASFPSIVAANANAALPHAIPGQKKLTKGSSVLIDWGAKWGGYCSDLTRVFALGSMSKKMREIYRIVLDAQQAAIETIKPGVKGSTVDAAARELIKQAGYGESFSHSLGHGIGMQVHEMPTLVDRERLRKPKKEPELEPGQLVTVEPGIYLPQVGGVRIEDDVLVTSSGYRVLSDLPKTLDEVII